MAQIEPLLEPLYWLYGFVILALIFIFIGDKILLKKQMSILEMDSKKLYYVQIRGFLAQTKETLLAALWIPLEIALWTAIALFLLVICVKMYLYFFH